MSQPPPSSAHPRLLHLEKRLHASGAVDRLRKILQARLTASATSATRPAHTAAAARAMLAEAPPHLDGKALIAKLDPLLTPLENSLRSDLARIADPNRPAPWLYALFKSECDNLLRVDHDKPLRPAPIDPANPAAPSPNPTAPSPVSAPVLAANPLHQLADAVCHAVSPPSKALRRRHRKSRFGPLSSAAGASRCPRPTVSTSPMMIKKDRNGASTRLDRLPTHNRNDALDSALTPTPGHHSPRPAAPRPALMLSAVSAPAPCAPRPGRDGPPPLLGSPLSDKPRLHLSPSVTKPSSALNPDTTTTPLPPKPASSSSGPKSSPRASSDPAFARDNLSAPKATTANNPARSPSPNNPVPLSSSDNSTHLNKRPRPDPTENLPPPKSPKKQSPADIRRGETAVAAALALMAGSVSADTDVLEREAELVRERRAPTVVIQDHPSKHDLDISQVATTKESPTPLPAQPTSSTNPSDVPSTSRPSSTSLSDKTAPEDHNREPTTKANDFKRVRSNNKPTSKSPTPHSDSYAAPSSIRTALAHEQGNINIAERPLSEAGPRKNAASTTIVSGVADNDVKKDTNIVSKNSTRQTKRQRPSQKRVRTDEKPRGQKRSADSLELLSHAAVELLVTAQDVNKRLTTCKPQDLEKQQQVLLALRELMKKDYAEPFLEPVKLDGAVDVQYRAMIRKPMDLGTIVERLSKSTKDNGFYANTSVVLSDIELVWENCRTFNGIYDDITVAANQCADELGIRLGKLGVSVKKGKPTRRRASVGNTVRQTSSNRAAKKARRSVHVDEVRKKVDEVRKKVDEAREKRSEMEVGDNDGRLLNKDIAIFTVLEGKVKTWYRVRVTDYDAVSRTYSLDWSGENLRTSGASFGIDRTHAIYRY